MNMFEKAESGAAICVNCAYFHQHYVLDKQLRQGFLVCNAGHCYKPRLKKRKPMQKACEHFEPR